MHHTRLLAIVMALVVGTCLPCASPGQVPATAPWESPTNVWLRASGGMLWGPYQTNRTPVAGSVQFNGSAPQWHNGSGWVPFSDGGGLWSETTNGIEYTEGDVNIASNLVVGGSLTVGDVAANSLSVTDSAYAVSWDGSTNVPTQNAIYDKFETLASVTFDPNEPSLYLDDVTYLDQGRSGPGDTIHYAITAKVDQVWDKILMGDLMSVSPNPTNVATEVYIYDSDYVMDVDTGITGTILATMPIESPRLAGGLFQKYVVWDLSPDLSLTNNQVIHVVLTRDDAAAPTWNSTYAVSLPYRPSYAPATAASDIGFGSAEYYGSGTTTTVASVKWGFPVVLYNPTNVTQTISNIAYSTTANLSVTDGTLSIEVSPVYMQAADSPGARTISLIDDVQPVSTNRTSRTSAMSNGRSWVFEAQSDFTLSGMSMNVPSGLRGEVWNMFIAEPGLQYYYSEGTLDDSGGSGDGWITWILQDPIAITNGGVYRIGFDLDGTVSTYRYFGYSAVSAEYVDDVGGSYLDPLWHWYGERSYGLNVQETADAIWPDWEWIVGDSVVDPIQTLVSGTGITFDQSGPELSIISTGGPNVNVTFSNVTAVAAEVDTGTFSNLTVNGSFSGTIVELSMPDAASQTITDVAGYVPVTNWVENVNDYGWTTTQTNITVATAGRYLLTFDGAFQTATASQLDAHFYTNGVIVADAAGNDIGWHRTQGAVTSDGVAACSRVVTLVAGSVVDFRIDAVGFDEDITWDTGTLRIERK